MNVDADLSDFEVQEFPKEKSGKSESEDSKNDNESTANNASVNSSCAQHLLSCHYFIYVIKNLRTLTCVAKNALVEINL